MDDLISRSDLLAAYDAAHKGPPGGARKLIEEAPAVIKDYTSDTDMYLPAIITALNKAIKKKPAVFTDMFICPNFHKGIAFVEMKKGQEYCHKCGQALDWEGM